MAEPQREHARAGFVGIVYNVRPCLTMSYKRFTLRGKRPQAKSTSVGPICKNVHFCFQKLMIFDLALACSRGLNMAKIDYENYIQSDAWKAKAEAAKKRSGGCAVCMRRTNLEVHHRTYTRLGHEWPSDLCVLCRPHHRLFHGLDDDTVVLRLPL